MGRATKILLVSAVVVFLVSIGLGVGFFRWQGGQLPVRSEIGHYTKLAAVSSIRPGADGRRLALNRRQSSVADYKVRHGPKATRHCFFVGSTGTVCSRFCGHCIRHQVAGRRAHIRTRRILCRSQIPHGLQHGDGTTIPRVALASPDGLDISCIWVRTISRRLVRSAERWKWWEEAMTEGSSTVNSRPSTALRPYGENRRQ